MIYPLGRGEEKRGCKDICSVWVRCPPSQATHLIYTCLSSHLTKLSRTSADERVLAARKEERKLPLIFWCETLLTLLSVGTPPAGKSRSDTDRVSGWKLTPIDESLLSPCSQILNPPVAVADRVTTIRTTFKSPSLARGRPHRQAGSALDHPRPRVLTIVLSVHGCNCPGRPLRNQPPIDLSCKLSRSARHHIVSSRIVGKGSSAEHAIHCSQAICCSRGEGLELQTQSPNSGLYFKLVWLMLLVLEGP